jgi:hypothetical protein
MKSKIEINILSPDFQREFYPTLLNIDGFKFFFYANEHLPYHVHISKGESFLRVELETLNISKNHMKPRDVKKAMSIVENNKEEFIRRWDEYFKQR